jgi:hypothetical protein
MRDDSSVNVNPLFYGLPLTLISLVAACGGAVTGDGDGGIATNANGIGAPCVTQREADPHFTGFGEQEVNVETSQGEPSGAPVCLVNHFRGRVTCPYGQDATGQGPQGTAGCTVASGGAVTGIAGQFGGAAVPAQCVDRLAADTVIRSCRCANNSGRTDDGDNYCTCPGGMTCTSVISSIGGSTEHLAGSYCIKAGTAFDRGSAFAAVCAPTAHACP